MDQDQRWGPKGESNGKHRGRSTEVASLVLVVFSVVHLDLAGCGHGTVGATAK